MDDFDTHVILCKWKKTPQGYRLWVKGRPGVFGEAESFEDAEKALTDAIWGAAEDLDAVIPTMPVYDPPLPAPALAERFLKPELYLVSGDGYFDIDARLLTSQDPSVPWHARKESGYQYMASLYTGGFCRTCHSGIGNRNEQSVQIGSYDAAYDGGSARVCYGFVGSYGELYSDRFLSLLTSQERERLLFRPVRLTEGRGRREYYELVSNPDVALVGVKGLDTGGWECSACGLRCIAVSEPALEQSDFSLSYFVCRADLPDPLLSCFVVQHSLGPSLCFTRQRWDQIRGQRGTKGILAQHLGVVSEEECDRHPRLHRAFVPCECCSPWPEPVTVTGEKRRMWHLPAIDCTARGYSTQNLEWIKPAQEAGLIQIVRQTLTLDEMNGLINTDTRPKRTEVISWRCPECWRLGRVILGPRELSLVW
jgi:hypothetical protein